MNNLTVQPHSVILSPSRSFYVSAPGAVLCLSGEDPMMKLCTKCGVYKTIDEFNKTSGSKDGRQGHCRMCTIEYARYIRTSPEGRVKIAAYKRAFLSTQHGKEAHSRDARIYKKRHPSMVVARAAVKSMVRDEQCSHCGSDVNIERHHYAGYKGENMKKVISLCASCHKRIHKQIGELV